MQMSRCGPRHSPHSVVLQNVCTTRPPPRPASVLGSLTHTQTHTYIHAHTNHHYGPLEQNSELLVYVWSVINLKVSFGCCTTLNGLNHPRCLD